MQTEPTREFDSGILPEAFVETVTIAEGRKLFDEAARFYTGLSGEEFLERWDAGNSDRSDPNLIHVVMLFAFACTGESGHTKDAPTANKPSIASPA